MSTAAAAEAPAPAPKAGKKKLIIIIVAAAVLVLSAGGAGAFFMLKKKPVAEVSEDGEAAPAKVEKAKFDPKAVPVFVPLDPFTVNLADRETERYAQVGITLEITEAKVGDQIKAFMPAIRNNILLTLADRTAGELMGRDGKKLLAERVRREASRALGYDVPEVETPTADADDDSKPAKKKKKKAAETDLELPVRAVHFSNFIIQ